MDRKRNHGSHEGHGREVLSDRPDTNPGVNALSEYLGIMESVNHLIVMDSESHGQHDVVTSTLQGDSGVTATSTVGAADAASASGVDAPSDNLDSSANLEAFGAVGGSASSAVGAADAASASGVDAPSYINLDSFANLEAFGAVGGSASHGVVSSPYVSGADDDMCEVEYPEDRDQQFYGKPGEPIYVNGKPRKCEKCGVVEGIHVETKHRACPICFKVFKDANRFGLVHKIR